jgi:hypothetical protein
VIGININQSQTASATKAAEKLGEGFSEDFLEKQFPKEYVNKRSTNVALQCQQIIQIYGKFGWEHYQQGQLSTTAMLYFRRKGKISESIVDLTPSEEAMISQLDPLQRP